MSKNLLCVLSLLLHYYTGAQVIQLGAGNSDQITVTTSSEYQPEYWPQKASGDKTIDGAGLDAEKLAASRFLAQATLGSDLAEVENVAEIGYNAWLDGQFSSPYTSMLEQLRQVHEDVDDWFVANGGDTSELGYRPNWKIFNYTWWDAFTQGDDALRHRIAFALSEILVISINSELEGYGDGLASYYDIFLKNAFGNYRDILSEVSLHPCMGFYLSHLNNPKAIPEENIHPDENYAREAMQLFSIGLYQLNPDGTRVVDDQGKDIPTYGQHEIKEFAKIWTGLGVADVIPNMYADEVDFGAGIYTADMTLPMIMYEDYHEPGEKQLLNGTVIPAGQAGMKDIVDAVDNLFQHPNVGPFIGRQLIQRLVKSNPSPAYIQRVSQAFDDNGQGVRGDMKAVIKAILLDEEARSCQWIDETTQGMLREPFARYTHFSKAVDIEHYYGRYWNIGYNFWEVTGQTVFGSPSVFNFFLPDYQPVGPIADAELVAPEFQIHNSRSSIGLINEVNGWTVYNSVFNTWEENDPSVFLNVDELKVLARDSEVLVNRLDMLFTHGQLSDRTRAIIKDALDPLIYGDYRDNRVRMALYLLMISPDYAILK